MNIIALGEVGIKLSQQGVSGADVATLAGLYRSISSGGFKASAMTDTQIAMLGRIWGELSAVIKDPSGLAEIRTLLASL